jgi:hypothetical protein
LGDFVWLQQVVFRGPTEPQFRLPRSREAPKATDQFAELVPR